ncbi:SH3 domain-binding glutamic acid-rich protein homolog [Neodiprion virginianus]|uniref:SH3 domain-binding glutamic acid-rich protein homolog n=1 Tax=Neodiprion virginianus TaxID=2961670 RepID=UPI001EE71D9D|nr:SH3 domain-binding glutamic acid-rich protein homolog [Neodiprion virginianus]
MVVKVYISGISGNKEVKKRQQRVLMILESKNVPYEVTDITEPGKEAEKEFMQSKSNPKDSKYPLPPQLFNDEEYCGDYEDFDLANEIDELEKFLKVTPAISTAEITLGSKSLPKEMQQNGNTSSREPSIEKPASTTEPESTAERRSSTIEETQTSEPKVVENETAESNESVEAPKDEVKDTQEDNTEVSDDAADKNEEKSDDQAKEE